MSTSTRRFFKALITFSITLLACAPCVAQGITELTGNTNSDQTVLLFNGDRVSGRIEEISKDSIRMLTRAMGEVTISLALVKEARSSNGDVIVDKASPIPSVTKLDSFAYVADSSNSETTLVNRAPSLDAPDASRAGDPPRTSSDSLACNTEILDSQMKLRPSIWTLGITTAPGDP
jgi:hypothetical protein